MRRSFEGQSDRLLENNTIRLNVQIDEQFMEYAQDVVTYGLARYIVDFGETENFKLWASYRMDQVQLKLCKNPGYTMKGTYVYDGAVYIL